MQAGDFSALLHLCGSLRCVAWLLSPEQSSQRVIKQSNLRLGSHQQMPQSFSEMLVCHGMLLALATAGGSLEH